MGDEKLQQARELLRLINVYGAACACYQVGATESDDCEVRADAYKAVRNFMKKIGLEFEE